MKADILQILSQESLKKSQLRRRLCKAKGDQEHFNRALADLKREGSIKKEMGGKLSLQELEIKTGILSLSVGGYGFVNPSDKSTTKIVTHAM